MCSATTLARSDYTLIYETQRRVADFSDLQYSLFQDFKRLFINALHVPTLDLLIEARMLGWSRDQP